MDTSDPEISFDDAGVCNHCHTHHEALLKHVHSGEDGELSLAKIVERIRAQGKGCAYDCVIGVSGGVDSTFTAWQVRQLGLRPLAVHLDNGWNSNVAVMNINKAIDALNIDLHTHVLDWEEYKDIQRAFLLASVPDVEIPNDHAILATLYKTAKKYKIRCIISGNNLKTESHLPPAWSQGHLDYGYIRDIHMSFGSVKLKSFPHLYFLDYLNQVYSRSNVFNVLNYVNYIKDEAVELISRELSWKNYGGKHHENIFTRWYQGCYLPRKFGFDKRRSHYSSLISTGQITRESALESLQTPPYDEQMQEDDCTYIAKKLEFTREELDAIMMAKPKRFQDYHSYGKRLDSGVFKATRNFSRILRKRISRIK
jgi:N-acetyl sugar amidotransferase